jgi:hypothetical protein
MKIVKKTIYVRKDKMNKQELVPVYCKISINNSETTFSLNIWVDLTKWQEKTQFKEKKLTVNEQTIRNRIDKICLQIDSIAENLTFKNLSNHFKNKYLPKKLLRQLLL